jgi:hypothetical protein
MARTSFSFTKRQKELDRKKKQEEKRQRKIDKRTSPIETVPDPIQLLTEGVNFFPDWPPDQLSQQIGLRTRREVEARLLAPLVAALSREFGQDKIWHAVRETVLAIARREGAALAQTIGGNSLQQFREILALWSKDQSLETEVIEEGEDVFSFNVTRCRYAEMYRDLGIPHFGPILSCARDFALIEGFNPQIRLTRTQTIMEGAPCCDFRYRRMTTP